MDTVTGAVAIPASAEDVFDDLSRIETVPERATEFVHAFDVVGPTEARARTTLGDVIVRLEADEGTRVIDYRVGPPGGRMALFPTRVVKVDDGSAYLFTMFRGPDQPEDAFRAEAASLRRERDDIVGHFSARNEAAHDQ